MMIRFCEFCGNVVREEMERCDVCSCPLSQDVEEEQFNNSENPWPFTPVSGLSLRIQGQERHIRVEGTHSLYHLWSALSRAYWERTLWFKVHNGEILLSSYPAGKEQPGFRRVEPSVILNCTHKCFSFYTFSEPDPELMTASAHLEMTYQGTFHMEDCPEKDLPYLVGWIVATTPLPKPETGWVYDL